MITQELDLNMVPGTVPPVINVSQFDTGARTFVFTLYNRATLFTGAVASCRIEGIKPDKKGFSYDASYNAGVVTADCTEQMTAVAGNVICELRLVASNGDNLGTLNFILCVERSPMNAEVDISETEIPAIIELAREQAEAAAASASQAASSARSASSSASAAAASAAHVDQIKEELQEHLDQIDTNTSNIAALRTDVDKNSGDISTLRTDVDKNISDIDNLENGFSDLTNLVGTFDHRITVNSTDINGLRTDVNKNKDDISKLRTDVDKNADDIADLSEYAHDKNDEQDELIDGLRTDLDENIYVTNRIHEKVFTSGLRHILVKQGVLNVLQGALTAIGNVSVIDELREDVDTNTSDISELRTDVDVNTEDISNLKTTVSGHTTRISTLENTVRTHGTDISNLRTDVDKNTDDINDLNTEVDKKLNRPVDNPCGDLNQLLVSNGDGTNSNKWVNLDDLLRDSELIQHIIDLIGITQGILTVQQGRLMFMQGHIKVSNTN